MRKHDRVDFVYVRSLTGTVTVIVIRELVRLTSSRPPQPYPLDIERRREEIIPQYFCGDRGVGNALPRNRRLFVARPNTVFHFCYFDTYVLNGRLHLTALYF
jgi:hypothetical protein